MKIAWTAFVLDRGRSGIATYIFSMLNALGKLDQVDTFQIYTPSGCEELFPPLPSNFSFALSPSFVEQPLVNILWHNSLLPWYSSAKNYDVVHIPSIRRVPLIKGCPVVATVHDMAPLALAGKYDQARTFYHRHILAKLVHRCDHVITVSHYTKSDLIRFTGYPAEKITVIYSGIDRETYKPLPKDEALEVLQERYGIARPFIVYVSRVEHPAKNHLNLIKAFELFKARHPSTHQLVLAGPDWSGAEVVKQYANASRVKESIHFLGSIPREDIVRLYSTCDFMVFPSLFEGFGFPLLEAMACGAPVICSNTTSLGELATGYADTFDPSQPEEICRAMVVAAGYSDRQSRIEKGMAYSATFSWAAAAQQVLKVYSAVC